MQASPRRRLYAISLIALLVLGGAGTGVLLRPASLPASLPSGRVLPAAMSAATREAVRQATSLSDAFVSISDDVITSVVRIEVQRNGVAGAPPLTARFEDFQEQAPGRALRQQPPPVPQLGGGTGFVVSADGYILTNNHVISGADRITVTLRDKRTYDAVVVGADPTTDVAVIRIEAAGLDAVALGDSDDARVGEWVLAIGNPGFDDASTLDFTVTGGIISAKGRPLNILGAELADTDPAAASYAIEDFIQTDAVINPGNSGGPLVDLRGTVIGINTAIASTTGYSQGYGFAIPSNLARRVMADLIEYGYVRRALLGISIADVTQEDAEVYRLPRIAGVVVEDFAGESPAVQSGLQRHDVIVAVAGMPIESVGQLQRIVALNRPGETVDLAVIRYGSPLQFRVRLTEAARTAPSASPPAAAAAAGLGLDVEELTADLARQLGYARPGGALVSRVAPASAADRKEVGENHRILSVNRQPVESAGHARAIFKAARPGDILSLVLEMPDRRTYIANIRIP
jgi:serine protease Do